MVVRHNLRPAASLEILAPHGTKIEDYVGDAGCAECHKAIHQQQCGSRMARALTLARDLPPEEVARPGEVQDPVNGLTYRVAREAERWQLQVVRGEESAAAPISYFLGSGERGLTPLWEHDAENYVELRVSYYADTQSWDFTPGQESAAPAALEEALGRRIDKKGRFGCLTCHSTLLVQDGGEIDLRRSCFGVHCERCHGPGRQHVESARRGDWLPTRNPAVVQAISLANRFFEGETPNTPQDKFLWSVAKARDDRLIRDLYMCGDCHGRSAIHTESDDTELSMFQVAALTASKCYQRSEKKLRCTDCHDPHRDIVQDDDAGYVAVCLKCHGDEGAIADPARGVSDVPAKICSVDPQGGCIECHMPKKSPMYRTRFTHHRIGLHSPPLAADH
jgi:hypothetical protein